MTRLRVKKCYCVDQHHFTNKYKTNSEFGVGHLLILTIIPHVLQDNGEEICDKLFLESEKITDICHMVSEMCSNVDSVPFVSKNVTDMFKDLTEWQEVVDSITSLKFGHLAEVERLHADLQDADAKIEAIQTEQLALQDEICQSGLVQGGLEEEAKELHADRATMKVELDALRQQAEWQRVQLTNEAQEAAVEKYKCLEKLTVLTTELKAKTLQLLKADSEIQRCVWNLWINFKREMVKVKVYFNHVSTRAHMTYFFMVLFARDSVFTLSGCITSL